MAIDLSLDEHQLLLQQSVADYLRRRSPLDVVRQLEEGTVGYSPEVWRELGGLGWLGINLPEEYGGTGGSFVDLMVLYEEFGRTLAPTPHLDTVVVAADVIRASGSDEQKQRVLRAMATGDHIVSLALTESEGSFGPASVTAPATRRGADYVLEGTKLLVAFAPSADSFLWVARTGGGSSPDNISTFLVDAGARGVSWELLPSIGGLPLYAVSCADVVVPGANLVGPEGGGWAPLAAATTKGAVLQTATIVGAARAVLDMTNQYAKDRQQFGGPIGRYQAVQYLVTNILLDLHRADLLTKQAVFRIATDRPYAREAAMAVAFGKRASAQLHRDAHEVHAGVAFILEHDLTLYSRRAKYWENNLGDVRYYEDQLATVMEI